MMWASSSSSYDRKKTINRLRKRDGDDCWLCCRKIIFYPERDNILGSETLDHVMPRSLGGGHEDDNLRLAHYLCNNARGSSIDPDEIIARIATLFDDDGNPNPLARRRQLLIGAMAASANAPRKDPLYPFSVWPRIKQGYPIINDC